MRKLLPTLLATACLVALSTVARSQPVIDGLTDCVYDDAGQPVCKMVATGNWTFVSKSFLYRYNIAVAAARVQAERENKGPAKTFGPKVLPPPPPPPQKQRACFIAPISKQPPSNAPPTLSCDSISSLTAQYAKLENAAATADKVTVDANSRMKALQAEMQKIGDACPASFRCSNVAGIKALRTAHALMLSSEAVEIGACATGLESGLLKENPLPSDVNTLVRDLSNISSGSFKLARKLRADAAVGNLRTRGFYELLKQCGDP